MSVARVLQINAAEASRLPPFILGADPPLRRRARGPYQKAAELDGLLAPFMADLAAGVPRAVVAKRVGVGEGQVGAWRARKGIQRHPGRPSRFAVTRFMARMLDAEIPAHIEHPLARVGGRWRAPEYVLREPLHYDAFVDVVTTLLAAGMSPAQIASGIGVVERDVAVAMEIAQRATP